MPPISLLIKPASSACNMNCKYCFYHAIANNRLNAFQGMLSVENLEMIVKEVMETAEGYCSFGFQGGEPTLRGLDFFRQLLEFQKKYNRKKLKVHNAIQTNGMLIDDEWAEFLAQNRFLVGLSIDGPEEIHNMNRTTKDGKDSFNRVMKAARIMEKHGVEFNILCVITGRGARSIEKIYNFFKRQGFRYLQFIPCLEPLESERGTADYSLGADEFGQFLIRLFDLWYRDLTNGEYISIRHIDNLIALVCGRQPELCSMVGHCTIQYVVEGDGGVYPCDYYVFDQWRLGTLGKETLDEMRQSEKARRFIEDSLIIPEKCKACVHLPICRNGCRRDRLMDNGCINYYCDAWKAFFDYAVPKLRHAAMLLHQGR